jgi:predicted nucleic acid-binding protein
MTTPALLCDTGALLSYLDARAPDHREYRKAIDDARARYVPGLVAAYPALRLGLVDASVVALAEEVSVVRIATRDVRDFSAVRLGDGRAFEIVVRPVAHRRGR